MQWQYLVQTISADVVTRLADAGVAPLVDGAILLGPEHIAENASPNRIVFVPKGSRYTPRDASMRQGRQAREVPQGSGVLSVFVTCGGVGYTGASVTISAPDLTGGIQATANAVVTEDVVHRVQ